MKKMNKIIGVLICLAFLIPQVAAIPFYRNPDGRLYGLYRAMENLEMMFAFNNENKAMVAVRQAERRMEEMEFTDNPARIAEMGEQINLKLETAMELNEGVDDEAIRERITERIMEANEESLQVLEQTQARLQVMGVDAPGLEIAIANQEMMKHMIEGIGGG